MTVKVRSELAALTDGRERFAGRSGVIERAPIGRLGIGPDPLTPGELFEAAYEVRFSDGDEAIFMAHELEGEGLIEHRPLEGLPFGGKDAGASVDGAKVKAVKGK